MHMFYILFSEKYLERKLFENLVSEECVKQSAEKNPSEEQLILQSLTEDSLQTALKEVFYLKVYKSSSFIS